jgi:CelD/BcsL family acetyltransferase involved in cellulose biosynthesis
MEGCRTLRIVLLKEIPDDLNLRREWNALVERASDPQVFYTYEWALAVQRAYSAILQPLIFLGYDEQGLLQGIAALAVDATTGYASFLCATTGDYCDFISLPGHKNAFTGEVLRKLGEAKIRNLSLTNLPADSNTLEALRQATRGSEYLLFSRTAYVCAQVRLSELQRRPGENKPVLPRKKMLRRFLNAMGREAPVRLDHSRSWSEIQPILPQFMQAHVARFLVTGRISNIARPERRVFLEELAKLLGENGHVLLTRMMSGANTFAWNYGFRFKDTWFWYQPTFDSDLEKYSPGFCLLAKVIEEAADDPRIKFVDLGLGAEEYKERFANHSRETLHVSLNISALSHLRGMVRYKAAEAVRAWPPAEKAMRSCLARAKGLRPRMQEMGLGQTLLWAIDRSRSAIAARDEVFFYELTSPNRKLLENQGVFLAKIDLAVLADAAMQNCDDDGTLQYLLRCAQRLQAEPESAGFVLSNDHGELLHFTWAKPFETFHWAELNSGLQSPTPGAMVMFDSWTPVSQRGRGYYAPTLALAVSRIASEGKRSWGFSASTNFSSVRGLEKAGFRRDFTVLRYRLLFWQRIVHEVIPQSSEASVPTAGAL